MCQIFVESMAKVGGCVCTPLKNIVQVAFGDVNAPLS
jgi:hypothetical protein